MSIHIAAKPGEIAKTVLMPGDPLRAKWIAENFLQDAFMYSSVRNMYGFTGTYKGKPLSVQGHGMGMPSMSIYAHELFNDYGVETAIRVGTCGGLKGVKIRDVVIAMSASTDSNINRKATGIDFAPNANYDLLETAVKVAREKGISHHVGGVATVDSFYEESNMAPLLESYGVLAVEMETSALYTLALRFGRRALSLLTVSDMLAGGEIATSEERETGFKSMIEIALEVASA
ncbi:MAG: purine-nucleoside phosphorylase [Actinomycetota bacterium]